MSIDAITAATDLDRYRTIRLEALAADPEAFGSTVDLERALDHDAWVQRVDRYRGGPGQIFIAVVDDLDAGVVGVGLREDPRSGVEAHLWGMWVRPSVRGRGVAHELIGATTTWAAEQGVGSISLSVRKANTAAIERYRRSGFAVVDGLGLAADDPCATELAMRRLLD